MKKQMVQRRIWQQASDVLIIWGYGRRQMITGTPFLQENDRPGNRFEQLLLCGIDLTELPDDVDRRKHDGKGLVAPPLAFTQLAHNPIICRVADQVEASQPLHGYDAAFPERLDALAERFVPFQSR
jgi:hypothetical protein